MGVPPALFEKKEDPSTGSDQRGLNVYLFKCGVD
jgi:hypothetical protein